MSQPDLEDTMSQLQEAALGASPLTIREARESDSEALRRVAQRDSAAVPDGRLLLAEQGEVVVAATSIANGRTIADPFTPTARIVSMLELRSGEIREARAGARRPLRDASALGRLHDRLRVAT